MRHRIAAILLAIALAACSDRAPGADAAGQATAAAGATPSPVPTAPAPNAADKLQAAADAKAPGASDALRLSTIVLASPIHEWPAARAIFPGVKWESLQKMLRGPYAPPGGPTHNQWAAVGEDFFNITGTPARVQSIDWSTNGTEEGDPQWPAVRTALEGAGVKVQEVGCHDNFGSGYYRLTASGKSAVVKYDFDFGGSQNPVTGDGFAIDFDTPFGEHTKDEIASGRVGYCE